MDKKEIQDAFWACAESFQHLLESNPALKKSLSKMLAEDYTFDAYSLAALAQLKYNKWNERKQKFESNVSFVYSHTNAKDLIKRTTGKKREKVLEISKTQLEDIHKRWREYLYWKRSVKE